MDNSFVLRAILEADNAKYNKALSDAENKAQGLQDKLEGVDGIDPDSLSPFQKKVAEVSTDVDLFIAKNEKNFETMGKLGKGMLLAGGLMSAGLGSAINTAAEFEAKMSEVEALSGSNVEQMQALSDKAREMGSKTKFSAIEAGDGFKYMALAGWSAEESIDAIDGVLALAAASGEDLGMVSDIVTDGMTAFGMEANKAGHFADVLAVASSESNTNVHMLGESFKYVAPLAGSMGFNIEDTALALGTMANAGIKSSQAGTTLKNALLRMAKPTKEVQKSMDELGIDITNADGSFKSLDEILTMIRESFNGLTDEQKAQHAATIFGSEALAGMLAIIGASDEEFDSLRKSVNNATGAAEDMAETMQDNLEGSIVTLGSAFDEFKIGLGTGLLPVFQKVVEGVTGIFDAFNSLSNETKELIGQIAGIIAVTTTLGGILLVGVSLIPKIVAGIKLIGVGITLLTGPIGLTIAALTALGGVLAYVGIKAKEDALEPIEELGEGLENLDQPTKAGLKEIENFTEDVTNHMTEMKVKSWKVTDEMADGMVEKFSTMKDRIIEVEEEQHEERLNKYRELNEELGLISEEKLNEAVEKEGEYHEKTIEELERKNDRVKEIMERAAEENRELTIQEHNEVMAIQKELSESRVEQLSLTEEQQIEVMERLKSRTTALSAEQAQEIIKNAIEQKEEIIHEANKEKEERLETLRHMYEELGVLTEEEYNEAVKKAEEHHAEKVKNAEDNHEQLLEQAKEAAGDRVDYIDWETGESLSKWQVFSKDMNKVFSDMWEGTKKTWNDFKKWNEEKWGDLSKSVKEGWDNIKEGFSDGWDNVKKVSKDAFNEWKRGVKENWDKLKKDMKDAKDKVIKGVKGLFKDIIDGTVNFFKDLWKEYKRRVDEARQSLDDKKNKLKKWTEDLFTDLVKGFVDGMKNLFKTTKDGMKDIWNVFKDGFKDIIKTVKDKWEDIKKNFTDGVKGAWKSVKEGFDDIIQLTIDLGVDMVKEIGKIPGKMVQLGKDIVNGLIEGITGMIGDAVEAVKGIGGAMIDGFKWMMDIRSPSRVFRKLGDEVVTGLIIGMDKRKEDARKVTEELGKVITKEQENTNKREKEIIKQHNDNLNKMRSKNREEIKKVSEEIGKERLRINEEYNKKMNDIEKEFNSNLNMTYKRRERLEKEALLQKNKELRNISKQEQVKKNKLRREHLEEERKLTEAHKLELLNWNAKHNERELKAIEDHVNKKKKLGELFVLNEAKMWESLLDRYQEGSNEALKVQENYNNSLERLYNELNNINNVYLNKMQQTNDKYYNQMNKEYDDFKKQLESRAKEIEKTYDIFDEVGQREYVDGGKLLSNLEQQTKVIEEWMKSMEYLEDRIDDEELIEELRKKGVKGIDEIQGLLKLTDSELEKYQELYRYRKELSQSQATYEGTGAYEKILENRNRLINEYMDELEEIEKEWKSKIEEWVNYEPEEMSLENVGKNLMQSMADGITSNSDILHSALAGVVESVGMDIGMITGTTDKVNSILGAGYRVDNDLMLPSRPDYNSVYDISYDTEKLKAGYVRNVTNNNDVVVMIKADDISELQSAVEFFDRIEQEIERM